MPGKNIVKTYAGDSVYHVYNRGVEKRDIFLDDQDYQFFLGLMRRHLGKEVAQDRAGRLMPNYHGSVELVAYCLMANHFHLLLWQKEPDGMTRLMRSVCTSYTTYFNKKYERVGSLFQGVYRASHITTDGYYQHISRYIHLNPLDAGQDPLKYNYSSVPYYRGSLKADWVVPSKVFEMFKSWQEYEFFLMDYKEHKKLLDELKYELADH